MAGTACAVPPTVQLSNSWAGIDGNWSTFGIAIGTPPQNFSVLPALTSGETWVPQPAGCQTNNPQLCAASRGVGAINGTQSLGFQTNDSSTWDLIGLFGLSYENYLFGGPSPNNGLYGQDTIYLGQDAGDAFKVPNQTVAGIATPDFWLGTLGLGVSPSEFSGQNGEFSSLLSSMKSQNLTPSLAFAYSAGASYKNAAGSVVFGGYEHALFDSTPINYQINSTNETALAVRLQSVVVTNTPTGTFSLSIEAGGVTLALDSTTSQLWLPQSWCDSLAQAFSLVFNDTTELYTLNTTTIDQALSAGTELTFTLAADDGSTTNIVFPFSAFDLPLGPSSDTRYFPIRRAANESQYVLGRAFMQEAYIVVDWERGNLTIGQNSHSSDGSVTPICPPPSSKSGLSAGAIAGIVVGVVLAIALLAVLGWFFWARRRKSRATIARPSVPELEGPERSKAELMSTNLHEMQEPEQQLMSNPIYELPAEVSELAGSPTHVELPGHEKR